jgi:hypothetical protein
VTAGPESVQLAIAAALAASEKLAEDILAAASRHFGKSAGKKKEKDKKAKGSSGNPVRGVLFSSFIVQ